MKMKKKWIIIPIVVVVVAAIMPVSKVIYLHYKKSKCETIENEIRQIYDQYKTCETDQDCFLETAWGPGCPFGCSNILSHKKVTSGKKPHLIEEKTKEYIEQCGTCKYGCRAFPKKNEIGCRNNKCVDLRR